MIATNNEIEKQTMIEQLQMQEREREIDEQSCKEMQSRVEKLLREIESSKRSYEEALEQSRNDSLEQLEALEKKYCVKVQRNETELQKQRHMNENLLQKLQ